MSIANELAEVLDRAGFDGSTITIGSVWQDQQFDGFPEGHVRMVRLTSIGYITVSGWQATVEAFHGPAVGDPIEYDRHGAVYLHTLVADYELVEVAS